MRPDSGGILAPYLAPLITLLIENAYKGFFKKPFFFAIFILLSQLLVSYPVVSQDSLFRLFGSFGQFIIPFVLVSFIILKLTRFNTIDQEFKLVASNFAALTLLLFTVFFVIGSLIRTVTEVVLIPMFLLYIFLLFNTPFRVFLFYLQIKIRLLYSRRSLPASLSLYNWGNPFIFH